MKKGGKTHSRTSKDKRANTKDTGKKVFDAKKARQNKKKNSNAQSKVDKVIRAGSRGKRYTPRKSTFNIKETKKVHRRDVLDRLPGGKYLKAPENRPRAIIVGVILVCLAVVIGSAVINMQNTTEKTTERELERIARDYYENYFYEQFLTTEVGGGELETAMEDYVGKGFPWVKLRQLLLFDDAKHAASRYYFEKSGYKCDTNTTEIKFIPVEPYGRTDYKIKYHLRCGKVTKTVEI